MSGADGTAHFESLKTLTTALNDICQISLELHIMF